MRDRIGDPGEGIRIVFVGTGLPAMAAAFAAEHAGGMPVLTDPTRRVFELAGMRRGVLPLLHWRFLANLLRALRSGFRQTRVQGDAWQQGGVLVLDASGRVLLRQVDAATGDVLDLEGVVAAL